LVKAGSRKGPAFSLPGFSLIQVETGKTPVFSRSADCLACKQDLIMTVISLTGNADLRAKKASLFVILRALFVLTGITQITGDIPHG